MVRQVLRLFAALFILLSVTSASMAQASSTPAPQSGGITHEQADQILP
jgi:hypothetical protein